MKKLNPYVIFMSVLLLFSCTTDDEIITETASELNLELTTQETNNNSYNSTRSVDINDEELQLNMHWMSFITTRTIFGFDDGPIDPDARIDFANIMASQESINLEQLIGETAPDGDFKTAFHANLLEVIQNIIHDMECAMNPMGCGAPEESETAPPLPPGGIGGPGGAPISDGVSISSNKSVIPIAEDVVDYLLNYVLNEHCLEIYTPKYIPATGDINEIAATEHPLSSSQTNLAIIFTNEFDVNQNQYRYYHDISPLYLQSVSSIDNYVIITRPKRNGRKCLYSEYSKIDFTQFFD